MRAVIQRVQRAEVRVAGEKVSEIGPGILTLLGVFKGDRKTRSLRSSFRKSAN